MWGHAVALCYKLEGRGFNSRWWYWNFPLIQFFRLQYDPGDDSVSNRSDYQEYFMGVKATDHAVALCYYLEGRGFDSRWCY